jgi:mono/diheme cytochrome c family protein
MTRLAAGIVLALALAGSALGATGNPTTGKTVFRAKCGSCHTLKAAGTVAKSTSAGPVLTGKRETASRIMKQLVGGGTGVMPVFVGKLTPKQITDVVAFVVQATKP